MRWRAPSGVGLRVRESTDFLALVADLALRSPWYLEGGVGAGEDFPFSPSFRENVSRCGGTSFGRQRSFLLDYGQKGRL